MTEEQAFKKLKDLILKFDNLMSNPEPGLITWNAAAQALAEEIRISFYKWEILWDEGAKKIPVACNSCGQLLPDHPELARQREYQMTYVGKMFEKDL